MTKEEEMARVDLLELDKQYYDEHTISWDEYISGVKDIEKTYGVALIEPQEK